MENRDRPTITSDFRADSQEGNSKGKMRELVITDNSAEMITIRWDGTRFSLVKVHILTHSEFPRTSSTTIINPVEAQKIANFITEVNDGII